MANHDYAARLLTEKSIYADFLELPDLPPIAHHWSTEYLAPRLRSFGFDSAHAMFGQYLERQCALQPHHPLRFLSIGSGICSLEIELASHLLSLGYSQFVIECLDLNPVTLELGRSAAHSAGIGKHLIFTEADFNHWIPQSEYDSVIANQSLHHVLCLEALFDRIKGSLQHNGVFLVSDMIGRNGHLRWPEALTLVHEFWRKLPPSYRFNHCLRRYEELYENWDCSQYGFEGVRSQDLLPCLIERFHFRLFVPFGNLIDPFIDRCFGPNFNPESAWDRNFIDEVHRMDRACIESGRIKPTHMLAVLGNNPDLPSICDGHLTPQFCVRLPDAPGAGVEAARHPVDPYESDAWPSDLHDELRAVCRVLSHQNRRIKELEQLEPEIAKRTDWALQVEKDLAQRTEWALRLEREAEEARARLSRLQTEFDQRTEWALQLNRELMALRKQTSNPFSYLAARILSRLKEARGKVTKKLNAVQIGVR